MEEDFSKDAEKTQDDPAMPLDIRSYRDGEEVIREGVDSLCFFVILSGQVRISQRGKEVRLLEERDIFGLESTMLGKRSLYTARTLSRSRIAAYRPEALDYFIQNNPWMTQSILSSILQQLIQTTDNVLDKESKAFAIDDVPVQFYHDGESIIQEGTTGTDFYKLVSTQGGLAVTIEGREISRIEQPGEFFGEMAGLLSLPRQATVRSIGESVVEVYNLDNLEVIVEDYPRVALQMMRTFVSRLASVDHKLTGSRNP